MVNNEKRKIQFLAGIVAITFIVYAKCIAYPFAQYDTSIYLSNNDTITNSSLGNFFKVLSGQVHNKETLFIPIFYLSFFIEFSLGFSYKLMHFNNILLHIINLLLLYKVLNYFKFSFITLVITICIYALHPIQVESVVWLMGRKDLLATFFLLLSIWTILQKNNKYVYISSILLFILSCLSKPVVISLSPLMVVLFFTNGKSIQKAIIKTIPYILITILFYLINMTDTQRPYAEFHSSYILQLFTHITERFFLIKSLSPMYFWEYLDKESMILGGITISGLLVLAIISLRKKYYLIFWTICFLALSMLPLLFIVIKVNRTFYTADRYLYIPMIAITILFSFIVSKVRNDIMKQLILGGVSIICIYQTWNQINIWKSNATLWYSIVSKFPDSYYAQMNYGRMLQANKAQQKAIKHLEIAYQISNKKKQPSEYLVAAYYYNKNYKKALPIINEMIEKEPTSENYLLRKLYILDKINEEEELSDPLKEEYLKTLKRLIEINPNSDFKNKISK